jgi:rubrerythrin
VKMSVALSVAAVVLWAAFVARMVRRRRREAEEALAEFEASVARCGEAMRRLDATLAEVGRTAERAVEVLRSAHDGHFCQPPSSGDGRWTCRWCGRVWDLRPVLRGSFEVRE